MISSIFNNNDNSDNNNKINNIGLFCKKNLPGCAK